MSLMDDIRNGESDRLEFKEIPSDRSDRWLKTAVAFANGRGGRILFGISNSRDVIGLEGDLFAIKDAISDAVASSCSPPIPAQVSITMVEGKPVIVLDVQEGIQTPYYLKSKGDVEGVQILSTRHVMSHAQIDLMK